VQGLSFLVLNLGLRPGFSRPVENLCGSVLFLGQRLSQWCNRPKRILSYVEGAFWEFALKSEYTPFVLKKGNRVRPKFGTDPG